MLFYNSCGGKMVNTQKGNSQLPTAEKTRFSETFLFLRLHSGKRKHSHPLTNYSTLHPTTGITFQNKGKVLDTVQLLDITTRVFFFLTSFIATQTAHTSPGSLGASSRCLLQLDRPEAMTKYKLVIPINRIMILVFWEKSFKSLEVDYSNRLTRSLVASCREISPSP